MKSFHSARLWLKDFLSVFVMVCVPTARGAAAAGVEAARAGKLGGGGGKRDGRGNLLAAVSAQADCAAPRRAGAAAPAAHTVLNIIAL